MRYNVCEAKVVGSKASTQVIAHGLTKGRAKRICDSKNEEALKMDERASIEGQMSRMISYFWVPEGSKVS